MTIQPEVYLSQVTSESTTREDYAKVRTDIENIADADVPPMSVDMKWAVGIGFATAERIKPYLAELGKLYGLDIGRISMLATYSGACLHAHNEAAPKKLAPAMLEQASEQREDLLMTAELLVRRGLVDPARVEAIRSGQGHSDLGNDLIKLSEVLLEQWAEVGHRIPVTKEEVDRAHVLGRTILRELGLKASPTESAQRNRERAFAMLVRVYEEVRRGLAYLRWYEDDVDAIAPSLYTRKKRRGGGATAEEPAVEQDGGAAAVNPTPETTDGAAE